MNTSNPSQSIDDFLKYFGTAIGADPLAGCEGATKDEVDQLQRLAGIPLPPLYEDYLLLFGRTSGRLDLEPDRNSDIRDIIEYYQENIGNEDSYIPERCVVTSRPYVTGLCLIGDDDGGEGSLQVGEFEFKRITYFVASAFANYLYRWAFLRGHYRPGSKSASGSITQCEPTFLQDVHTYAVAGGFHSHWFSDPYQICLERDDIAILGLREGRSGVVFFLCQDEKRRLAICREFIDRFQLRDTSMK